MNDMPRRRMSSSDLHALLRREILNGNLQPSEQLPTQRALAEQHGVARGTVREALLRLARNGFIEIRRGSGAYVTYEEKPRANPAIENARPLELIDARFALEPHICRLAVLHAGRAELDRAARELDHMEAAENDPKRFSEADMAFHSALAEATGNGLLTWIIAEISSVRDQQEWGRMLRLTLTPETIRIYNRQHRAIFEAIRRRDPESAARHMKEHLETARLSLTRAAAA